MSPLCWTEYFWAPLYGFVSASRSAFCCLSSMRLLYYRSGHFHLVFPKDFLLGSKFFQRVSSEVHSAIPADSPLTNPKVTYLISTPRVPYGLTFSKNSPNNLGSILSLSFIRDFLGCTLFALAIKSFYWHLIVFHTRFVLTLSNTLPFF